MDELVREEDEKAQDRGTTKMGWVPTTILLDFNSCVISSSGHWGFRQTPNYNKTSKYKIKPAYLCPQLQQTPGKECQSGNQGSRSCPDSDHLADLGPLATTSVTISSSAKGNKTVWSAYVPHYVKKKYNYRNNFEVKNSTWMQISISSIDCHQVLKCEFIDGLIFQ